MTDYQHEARGDDDVDTDEEIMGYLEKRFETSNRVELGEVVAFLGKKKKLDNKN